MTLAEEIDELDRRFNELAGKSPKTKAEMQEKEMVRRAFELAIRRQEKTLMDELAGVGINAEVWDLVNTSSSYPEAIPILISHLGRSYHDAIREGIVRSLAVKEAKGLANKAIIAEYHKVPKEDHIFRWAFGNTMRVIVTNDDLDDLIGIVLDETNGDSRNMFVRALAKIKSPKVREVLSQLAKDKCRIVADEAKRALKRKRPAN